MINMKLNIPAKIYFGSNSLNEGIVNEGSLFQKCVIIVTGKSTMEKLGYLEQLIKLIKKHYINTEIVHFNGVSPNPKVNEINEAIKLGIKKNVDLVIGLGGGSAIDAAKAIAVGIGDKSNINDYVLGNKIPTDKTLPIIAIPSTAGTGSELSRGAIISFPEKKIKTGIRGDELFPKVAIVNPEFTYSISERHTMEMGFDVLTHAIETYISKKANVFTEMLSLEAIKLVAKNLPMLMKDLYNHDARFQLSYASMIMGINLGNASTCLPHRLQYPIGAKTDTSHGAGLACLYPSWFYYSYDRSSLKFNEISSILTGRRCETKEEAINSLIEFMKIIKVNYKLSDLGVSKDDIELLVLNVKGSIENDPVSNIDGIVNKIYYRALEGQTK